VVKRQENTSFDQLHISSKVANIVLE